MPFYLRPGKRLGRRAAEIAVVFKRAPNLLFTDHAEDDFGQNAVVIRVQPDEGVTIRFGSKAPGTQMEVRDVTMDFGYGRAFTESSPEAYEPGSRGPRLHRAMGAPTTVTEDPRGTGIRRVVLELEGATSNSTAPAPARPC